MTNQQLIIDKSGYTPSSNFGNCAADGLVTAYEKVVDVTYNRGTVTELTTR